MVKGLKRELMVYGFAPLIWVDKHTGRDEFLLVLLALLG